MKNIDEKELEKVTGGTCPSSDTYNIVESAVRRYYSRLPEEILNLIMESYRLYGAKAAKAMCEKLLKGELKWAIHMKDLFK